MVGLVLLPRKILMLRKIEIGVEFLGVCELKTLIDCSSFE